MSKKTSGIGLSYIPRDSLVHNLTGTTKLATLLIWSFILMLTFDTRILITMFFLSIMIFIASELKVKEVIKTLTFVLIILLLNLFFIYLFSPEQGVEVYGTKDILFQFSNRYTVTKQQLFYMLNVLLKYFVMSPLAIIFLLTTEPSEFAASLSAIGVSYKISYAVSLALRYIPDVQRSFATISKTQQAKGIALSKNERFLKRLKNTASILTPLILTNLSRIEQVADAMALRDFGKYKKRTWYRYRAFKRNDYIVLVFLILFFVFSMFITYSNENRFYNPFIK